MILLGKYESLGVLGRGSMGQVHAARPEADPARTVVVKVMRPDLAASAHLRESFDRELRYTSRLRHPYIVRVLDHGLDETAGPCIVMEFVPGQTLESVLRKERRLAPQRAGWLFGGLCHALQAAHAANIVHRDLKPANLMVVNLGTPQEHIKVMDFGLSQLGTVVHLSKERFSGSGDVRTAGTPAYISPEQVRGDEIDGRADLYSAGVILYEALAGRLPFAQTDVASLIQSHLRETPPTFAAIGVRDVPAAVETVVRRCLSKFPPERARSARELAAELGRALNLDLWGETTPSDQAATESALPVAEAVPREPDAGPNALVRVTEAWMPDRIAVIKIGGFLRDAGGELLESEPGVVRATFPPLGPPLGLIERWLGRTRTGDGIALDINLRKPDPNVSRLEVTAVFRLPGGGAPRDPNAWRQRAIGIFEEMKRYLMA